MARHDATATLDPAVSPPPDSEQPSEWQPAPEMPDDAPADPGDTVAPDDDNRERRIQAYGKILGNVSTAALLLDVDSGRASAEDYTALVEAATKIQTRALKRYLKLRDGIGRRLAEAATDYQDARGLQARMTDRLIQQ